jgi:hypothetical protein
MECFSKCVEKGPVALRNDKNKGYFTRKLEYIDDRISLNVP